MKKLLLVAFFLTYNLHLTPYNLYADTIYAKDGRELKGIVVEDYKDRVVFSTVDGQITVMKSDMKELYFDTEEQNLIKLAEQAKDKSDYIKAFVYYDRAFKLNPDSKVAKDGIVFLQGYLFKKDMAQKEEAVKRHNEFEQRGGVSEIKSDEDKFNEALKRLRKEAGVVLATTDGMTKIESVMPGSPAEEVGIRNGDTLVAVWGRLVGYMSLKEIVEAMLEKNSLETKITLGRDISVEVGPDGSMGASLSMQFDGLTVSAVKDGSAAYETELRPGDIITAINGNSTRYMPLNKAIESIKRSKGVKIGLTVRKEMVMWGKGGSEI